MPSRLTHSQIEQTRVEQIARQGNKCAICGLGDLAKDPVLDHHHGTGAVRQTLHRSCNALLGNIENNYQRWGVKNLYAFLHGAAPYLQRHETNITGLIHPTHKTAEEKRIATNLAARNKRAGVPKRVGLQAALKAAAKKAST